jgi:prefoldin subunit 5
MILSARQRTARRALEAGYRPGIWGGWLGRWILKLASLGLKHPAVAAVNRPTELAIGAAVDVLFQAMPKDLRRALVELPGVVRRLEQQAEETRARVDELDRLIAEANALRPAVRTTERRAAMGDLEAARGAAQWRMGEIVTALEGIRLDLLRLRVGAGSVESVTADLAAAREIGEHTERLVQAGQDIEAVLRSPPASP